MTVLLFHSGFSSVVETTYLGMLFIFTANSPSVSSMDGQALAKPS
jgi:hypothetical protein